MAKTDKSSPLATVLIIAALGLCSVAAGWYLWENRAPEPPPAREVDFSPTEQWDQERWMGIYQNNTKIGYLYSRLRKTEYGFDQWHKYKIVFSLNNEKQDVVIDLQARLNPDYTMRQVDFEADSGFMDLKASGEVKGDELIVKADLGGGETQKRLKIKEPPVIDPNWILADKLRGAEPGQGLTFTTFEPLTQQDLTVKVTVISEETIEINGEQTDTIKAEATIGGMSEWFWLDKKSGEVVKEQNPGSGLTMISEPRDKALDVDWANAGGMDMLSSLMVPSSTVLLEPRSISFMRLRLTNAPLDGLDLSSPPRQTANGSTVEVTMAQAMPAKTYALPITKSLPDKASEFSEWLTSTPAIQSDNSEIQKAARKAAGGADDAVSAVDGIVEWIGDEIEPSLVVSVPSALDVLKKKRGACKEHTVLFTALARAQGIPTRMVAGIVYSDQQMIEGFYYHAWAEVYIADGKGQGNWVAVDPTFGQFPADATHIKLKQGEIGQMLDLMQVIGLLQVKVEEYR